MIVGRHPRVPVLGDTALPAADGWFRVGDLVRNGAHTATVTDVGTVLVAVMTAVGTPKMVCPWELVRLCAAPQDELAPTPQRGARTNG